MSADVQGNVIEHDSVTAIAAPSDEQAHSALNARRHSWKTRSVSYDIRFPYYRDGAFCDFCIVFVDSAFVVSSGFGLDGFRDAVIFLRKKYDFPLQFINEYNPALITDAGDCYLANSGR